MLERLRFGPTKVRPIAEATSFACGSVHRAAPTADLSADDQVSQALLWINCCPIVEDQALTTASPPAVQS